MRQSANVFWYMLAGISAAVGLAWLLIRRDGIVSIDEGLGAVILGGLRSFTKGSRVTYSSDKDGDGLIDQDPYELATAANLDIDTYTLARIISSEEGNSSNERQAAVAFVSLNNAATYGGVYAYATGGGPFGHQEGIRKVTTFNDPYQGHVDLAVAISAGDVADTTGGATNFFNPTLQDKLHAKNPAKYRTADEVRAKWEAGGLVAVVVEGIDPADLLFFRPA